MPLWQYSTPSSVSILKRAVPDLFSSPVAVALSLSLLVAFAMGLFSRKQHFQVEQKHVIVTGGSQGLGLSLATLLAARGAHITVMARTATKLEEAVREISTHRRTAEQKIAFVTVDLRNHKEVERAFEEACRPFDGRAPDVVIAAAGGASGLYGFFTEITPEAFQQGWDINYMTALWASREAARRMAQQEVKGHIVLVSSIAGLLGYACSAAYTPAKAALRGLADCLRNEFLLYGIQIHCHFPGGIESPGFHSEQEGKPEIAKMIEDGDIHLEAHECATRLLNGLDKGEYFISTDLIGAFARTSFSGPSPRNNILLDFGYEFIAYIGLPIWRMSIDRLVRKSSPQTDEHLRRLRTKGATLSS